MRTLHGFIVTAVLISLFLIPSSSQAVQRTVTSLADSGPGSLRAAIASAGGGDEIVFAVPLPGTIELLSEIPVNAILTITGPGADLLTLDGGGTTRIFNINDTIDVTISGLRFFNGFSGESGGAIYSEADTLIINDCIFESNEVSCDAQDCLTLGGAIHFTTGIVGSRITNTTFLSNRAYCTQLGCSTFGGAYVHSSSGSSAEFTGCTFEDNEAECIDSNCLAEGGVYFTGSGGVQQTFLNCTFFNNRARCEEDGCQAFGGSIADGSADNPTNLSFCTFSSDSAECIGAGCTAQGNSVWVFEGFFDSNIFFNTSPEGSCGGSNDITSLGYNFDSGDNCLGAGGPGDRPFTNPRLFPGAPLDNGGQTPTIALLPNSPAINSGNPACPPPDTDQRGVVRPQFERCDSGAFEFEGAAQVSNIPTLSEWGMLAMFLVLGITGFIALTKLGANA
jgi:predicted outer membrane repeat protein